MGILYITQRKTYFFTLKSQYLGLDSCIKLITLDKQQKNI